MEKWHKQEANSKKVRFNPVPELFQAEEVVTGKDERIEEEEEIQEEKVQEDAGFKQQGGRITCIVCGLT